MATPYLPHQRGQSAEKHAREWLESQGLTFVSKNFRCAAGEIDLIMRDAAYLVFIEVRARHSPDHGDSLHSITPAKRSRLIRSARFYLLEEGLTDQIDCRFDVIGYDANHVLRWIKDAFQVQY